MPGRRCDGLADLRDEEDRQDARVQAPRPEHDDLRVGDRGDRRPRPPRTSLGSIQTRSMSAVRMIVDCPLTTSPPRVRARRLIGVADAGTTLPRTARTRFIRRTPSSKSPPSSAVIAASSRFPTGVPAEAARLGHDRPVLEAPEAREAVAEEVAHERLRVGQRGDAVPDVADGRDAELLAQRAGRAAVVGHGHDRGEVARVLLEAAQERREAGPAADRDDPRPAREEALLVEDVGERPLLVRAGAAR